jgi:hypothetical protein
MPIRSPASPIGPAPTSIDEAQRDIARWRQVLGLPASAGASAAPTGSATQGTGYPPSTPGATPTPQTLQSAPDVPNMNAESDSTSSDGNDTCATPCRAIASMRRSVDVLCSLAGETDERCVDARRSLEESERVVARCGC